MILKESKAIALRYQVTQLLSSNPKVEKGERFGYLTAILHLSPATSAGGRTVCPNAHQCQRFCLTTAGHGGIGDLRTNTVQIARKRKTRFYLNDRAAFETMLADEIASIVRSAERRGLIPCVRINGTSDLPGLATVMARQFYTVRFYDYTKLPKPESRQLANYHLTASWDGEPSWARCQDALRHGINVAVPFRVCRHGATCHCPLPTTWRGIPVIDGDVSDLRFLDPAGVIVGLRAKGRARSRAALASGFTVDVR